MTLNCVAQGPTLCILVGVCTQGITNTASLKKSEKSDAINDRSSGLSEMEVGFENFE